MSTTSTASTASATITDLTLKLQEGLPMLREIEMASQNIEDPTQSESMKIKSAFTSRLTLDHAKALVRSLRIQINSENNSYVSLLPHGIDHVTRIYSLYTDLCKTGTATKEEKESAEGEFLCAALGLREMCKLASSPTAVDEVTDSNTSDSSDSSDADGYDASDDESEGDSTGTDL